MDIELLRQIEEIRTWRDSATSRRAAKAVFKPKTLPTDIARVIDSELTLITSPHAVKAVFDRWERAVYARHDITDWGNKTYIALPRNTRAYVKSLTDLKVPLAHIDRAGSEHYKSVTAAKALTDVRTEFETAAADLFNKAMKNKFDQSMFESELIILIVQYAEIAMLEGYNDGGIPEHEIEEADIKWLDEFEKKQTAYVENVAKALYADKKLTPDELKGKPQMWWNMSIMPAYNEGLSRASKDGVGVWVMGATEQHCTDCFRLNYKARRFSFWLKYLNGDLPPSKETECGGFRCECRIIPFQVPANRGAMPKLVGYHRH